MSDSNKSLTKIKIFDKVTLNNSTKSYFLDVSNRRAVGFISLQISSIGAGSSTTFTFKLSNDYDDVLKTGTFVPSTLGSSIGTVANGVDFFPLSLPNCQWVEIIATETATADAVLNVTISIQ